jgi:hypothetical protein
VVGIPANKPKHVQMKKLILLLAFAFIAFFPVKAQREVTGRVTDANGAPLIQHWFLLMTRPTMCAILPISKIFPAGWFYQNTSQRVPS